MSIRLISVAAAATLVCSPAFAADGAKLSAIQGSVLISQGGKVVPATATQLKTGDRVVAQANGSASLQFADGCTISVKPASMVTIGAKSPCASGAGLVNANGAQAQEIWGMSNTTAWIVGLVVVGGAAAVIANNTGSSSSP